MKLQIEDERLTFIKKGKKTFLLTSRNTYPLDLESGDTIQFSHNIEDFTIFDVLKYLFYRKTITPHAVYKKVYDSWTDKPDAFSYDILNGSKPKNKYAKSKK